MGNHKQNTGTQLPAPVLQLGPFALCGNKGRVKILFEGERQTIIHGQPVTPDQSQEHNSCLRIKDASKESSGNVPSRGTVYLGCSIFPTVMPVLAVQSRWAENIKSCAVFQHWKLSYIFIGQLRQLFHDEGAELQAPSSLSENPRMGQAGRIIKSNIPAHSRPDGTGL